MRIRLPSVLGALVTVLAVAAVAQGARGSDPVLHATELGANGRIEKEIWTSRAPLQARTVNYDSRGKVVGQSVVSITGDRLRLDNVFYPARQWRTSTSTLPPSAHHIQVGSSAYFPSEIRKLVSTGVIGQVGRPTIRGRKTVQLQGQMGPQLHQIWVEPRTFLVVQVVVRSVGGPVIEKLSFDWLPGTRATRAKLKLVVPRGFERLA